ncbi:hypothetical protein BY458DRAFT_489430 [Sporodiniella umbellata]|nr:hypothetical protein BY458DRAFT_489430 [Sporodiniella umbellata]
MAKCIESSIKVQLKLLANCTRKKQKEAYKIGSMPSILILRDRMMYNTAKRRKRSSWVLFPTLSLGNIRKKKGKRGRLAVIELFCTTVHFTIDSQYLTVALYAHSSYYLIPTNP